MLIHSKSFISRSNSNQRTYCTNAVNLNSITNQRIFFDDLAERLHIKNPEDWLKWKSSWRTVLTNEPNVIDQFYNSSLLKGTIEFKNLGDIFVSLANSL
jgi:hypothetical protein